MEFPILSLMLAVPLAGAIACLFLGAHTARMVALVATLIDLALGVVLCAGHALPNMIPAVIPEPPKQCVGRLS